MMWYCYLRRTKLKKFSSFDWEVCHFIILHLLLILHISSIYHIQFTYKIFRIFTPKKTRLVCKRKMDNFFLSIDKLSLLFTIYTYKIFLVPYSFVNSFYAYLIFCARSKSTNLCCVHSDSSFNTPHSKLQWMHSQQATILPNS